MTIWQRIWQWLACRDPDDDVDSGYPEATQPIPQDMHTPGPDTHKMMVQRFPSPSAWDSLSDRRRARNRE